jgi:hypothetical protein
MGPVFTPADATVYTAGVDRSPTEVAALFAADHPDADPVQFLVEALELDEDAATEAVSWIPSVETPDPDPAAEGDPSADTGTGAPADAGAGEVVELTAEGLAGLTREQLVDIAKTAGITIGNKGAERLAAEILEVVAYADALDAENPEG